MTIFDDYNAFLKENIKLIEFIFEESPAIRSWIEPAMYVVENKDKSEEIDDQMVDFICTYLIEKIDFLSNLITSNFKGDLELVLKNAPSICCYFHLSDMLTEGVAINQDKFEEPIEELMDELLDSIYKAQSLPQEIFLKIETLMQQLEDDYSEELVLANEVFFEMADLLGFVDPYTEELDDEVLN